MAKKKYNHIYGLVNGTYFGPSTVALTPWNFAVFMDKEQVAVLRECCDAMTTVGFTMVPEGEFHKKELTCASCGTPVYTKHHNDYYMPWRKLTSKHLEKWLAESTCDPLTAEIVLEELAADFQSWLLSRGVFRAHSWISTTHLPRADR